jgi:hypothetical protein
MIDRPMRDMSLEFRPSISPRARGELVEIGADTRVERVVVGFVKRLMMACLSFKSILNLGQGCENKEGGNSAVYSHPRSPLLQASPETLGGRNLARP